jgi:hypothetical protein
MLATVKNCRQLPIHVFLMFISPLDTKDLKCCAGHAPLPVREGGNALHSACLGLRESL